MNATAPSMDKRHAKVFQDAARVYGVHILVRQTNAMSLRFVGQADCMAKRLDCKAKTAARDWAHPQHGPKESAGLVVDPTITGPGAFASPTKHAAALEIWAKFPKARLQPLIRTAEGQRKTTWIPSPHPYFVDLDPRSRRYGCLKFAHFGGLITAGRYIHGDFDLYAIVPAGDPARNVAVHETRLGEEHARSPEFLDVQHFVNSRIGVPMVLHGAQESAFDHHTDEPVDVFSPDGSFRVVRGAAEMEALYETVFGGRRLFTRDGPREFVRGRFQTPA